jgi:8-hydroxy-5-deazaflavin:NADPH oxidoreductase
MKKIQVGILGSGIVGQVLADGFIKHGYSVMIGTRSPDKLSDWQKKAGKEGRVGSFEEAAKFGDLLVLASKGTVVQEVLKQSGEKNLAGKTIMDVTNPIADAPPEDGVLKYFTSFDDSLLERNQRQVPAANFVKAFNSVGNAFMINPKFKGGTPTMFICGNNPQAKKQVQEIVGQFGWEAEDMGTAKAARAIEPLCMLWCIPGLRNNQWNHAFKLLKT